MKRLAFISDVHANLEALEAILRDVDTQRPDLLSAFDATHSFVGHTRALPVSLDTRRYFADRLAEGT